MGKSGTNDHGGRRCRRALTAPAITETTTVTNWLEKLILKRLSAKAPDQYGWLYSVARVTPGVLWKLAGFSPLATHCKRTPPALIHLARIGAMQVYDCGTCLQIAIDFAIKDGVAPETVRNALLCNEALPDEEQLAFDFGKATACADTDLAECIQEVRTLLGDGAHAELALAVSTAAVFPIFKRGLGVATACALDGLTFGGSQTA